MTPDGSNTNNVYGVYDDGDLYSDYANFDSLAGARPVIVTNKINIK